MLQSRWPLRGECVSPDEVGSQWVFRLNALPAVLDGDGNPVLRVGGPKTICVWRRIKYLEEELHNYRCFREVPRSRPMTEMALSDKLSDMVADGINQPSAGR